MAKIDDMHRVARAPRDKVTAGFTRDAELGRALRGALETTDASRAHRESVAAARTQIETSIAQLELALRNVQTVPALAPHPVLEELRDAILAGRKMLARFNDILKRMP